MSDLPSNLNDLVTTDQGLLVIWNELRTCTGGGGHRRERGEGMYTSEACVTLEALMDPYALLLGKL